MITEILMPRVDIDAVNAEVIANAEQALDTELTQAFQAGISTVESVYAVAEKLKQYRELTGKEYQILKENTII